MNIESQVIISSDIDETIEKLKKLQSNERFIEIVCESGFLVDDIKEVFAKASIASEEPIVIIMAAKTFSDIVQNRLLKLLEEPPKNKVFIIIAPQKAMILDTIKSRLPLYVSKVKNEKLELGLDVANLSLQSLFLFSKLHRYTKPAQIRPIVDEIIRQAIKSSQFKLDYKTLELLGKASKSLLFGTQANFVLSMVLLKLLANKKDKNLKPRTGNETIQNRR
jgi:DNA polymerase-3 subunit delta'